MNFAIIETGGKQYKVTPSKILKVDLLAEEAGKTVKLKNVLLLNNNNNTEIGSPLVDGAYVEAKILANTKERKILVFKKKRRKHYRKKNGHRQQMSKIQILKIASKSGVLEGKELPKKEVKKKETKEKTKG